MGVKTWNELFEDSYRNWSFINKLVREDCLCELRASIPDPADIVRLRDIVARRDWDKHHFFFGMAVRNTLRRQLLDEELPGVRYADGKVYRNWDDYYLGALIDLVKE